MLFQRKQLVSFLLMLALLLLSFIQYAQAQDENDWLDKYNCWTCTATWSGNCDDGTSVSATVSDSDDSHEEHHPDSLYASVESQVAEAIHQECLAFKGYRKINFNESSSCTKVSGSCNSY